MKKIFTLAALAATTLVANAQIEGGNFDVSAFDKTGTQTAAGLALGSSTHVTVATGTVDNKKTVSETDPTPAGYKTTSSKYNKVEAVVITAPNGEKVVIDTNSGLTGSDNARNSKGDIPGGSISAIANGKWTAATGCTYAFTVKTGLTYDYGCMYIVGKFSGNKEFIVLEDGEPIPYFLVYDGLSDNSSIVYVEPSDMGYDEDAFVWNEGATYPTPDAARSLATVKKNGTGVVFFDVAPGRTYLVTANGSKPTISGYALVNGDMAKQVECARMGRDGEGNATAQEQSVFLVKPDTEGFGEINKGGNYEAFSYVLPTTTAVAGVAEAKAEVAAPVKVLGANGIQIGNYNIAGQQVK